MNGGEPPDATTACASDDRKHYCDEKHRNDQGTGDPKTESAESKAIGERSKSDDNRKSGVSEHSVDRLHGIFSRRKRMAFQFRDHISQACLLFDALLESSNRRFVILARSNSLVSTPVWLDFEKIHTVGARFCLRTLLYLSCGEFVRLPICYQLSLPCLRRTFAF